LRSAAARERHLPGPLLTTIEREGDDDGRLATAGIGASTRA